MLDRKTFNPAVLAIISEAFLSRLSFGVLMFALPLYARALGMTLAEIAVLITANTMISMLLKPYIGRLADWLGYKRGAIVAIAVRSALTVLFALTSGAWQLFALQTARGAAKALRDPSMEALIAEHGGRRTIASAFAWYKTATSAAGALGKALAGALLTLTASNFLPVFVVAFLFSVLPLLVVSRYVPATTSPAMPAEDAAAPASSTGIDEGRMIDPKLWPAIGFGFLVSATAQMLRSLFPVLAVEYGGLSEAETGVLYLVATIVVLVAGPIFGWLVDNVSRKLVLMTRSVANIASSAIYLAFPSFPGFVAGKAVDEAGKAAFHPAWGSLMADLSNHDRARRGRVMGPLGAAVDAGSIAGPIVAGLLWTVWGIGALLAARIALAILTEVYAWWILTRATAQTSDVTHSSPQASST